jgi:hypothetical protein
VEQGVAYGAPKYMEWYARVRHHGDAGVAVPRDSAAALEDAQLVVTRGVTLSMRGKHPFGVEGVLKALEGAKDQSATGVCRAVLDAAHAYEKRGWGFNLGRKPAPEDMTALAMVRVA